jgi:hypothetical protein
MPISRRDLFKFSAITVATTAMANTKKEKINNNQAHLRAKTVPRVVIVGGGWSGLSIAKNIKNYTKQKNTQCEVILVEQRHQFVSCPMSNLWLVDKVDLEYLTYDYYQGARNGGYEYFQATATGLNKQNQILHTTNGDIEYDHIVFAPGIDYDYSSWVNGDYKLEQRLRQEYPAGFIAGSEHHTIKSKIHKFKGGNFLLTIPGGNYRCLPAPYERACIFADYFKHKGIKAKIIILDENNDITIKEHGFHTAFDKMYKGLIEYYPNSKIESIDLDNKIVETEFEEFTFDDASFYPHIRGGKILQTVGIAKDTVYNKLEGDIDPITYEVKGYDNIYVSGDARPMGFSKSGNTSNTEGQYVAKLIATKLNKEPKIPWQSPITICFSATAIYPERAIFIHSDYAYDKKKKSFYFATPISSEKWSGKDGLDNAKGLYDWANSLYIDMFGA